LHERTIMARSRLTNTTQDLIADSGSVLWSFVKGEQLEFPVTLNFIEDASVKAVGSNYTYEAVVVEALNLANQTTRPTAVRPGGVANTLFIRLPILLGTWSAGSAYNKEEVVLYQGVYYKLAAGTARTNATPPSTDPMWVVTQLNKIYIQYPASLASTWSVQPTVDSPVYGFFELRVTEPNDPVFIRTFKPVRGMVEILFSPTDVVVDVAAQTT
jgi:hypothetical protein